MMLSLAPELTRAVMGGELEGNRSSPERVGLMGEAESATELTSMPLVTGELWLLPGIDPRSVLADRSTFRDSASIFSPSPPGEDGCDPPALAPDPPLLKGAVGVSGRKAGITGDQWREGLRGGTSERLSLLDSEVEAGSELDKGFQ